MKNKMNLFADPFQSMTCDALHLEKSKPDPLDPTTCYPGPHRFGTLSACHMADFKGHRLPFISLLHGQPRCSKDHNYERLTMVDEQGDSVDLRI
jgi:hypothetical protein